VAHGLQRREVDVLTALEDHADRLIDQRLMERATELGRLLFTQDKGFLRMADHWIAAGREFAGLAYTPQRFRDYRKMIDDLDLIAKVHEPAEVRNQIFYIPL
jgi:hypothetical protein